MTVLRTHPNLSDVDDVYEQLLAMHDGRGIEDSLRIAARLNLILLNHIGDRAVIDAAFALAGSPVALPGGDPLARRTIPGDDT